VYEKNDVFMIDKTHKILKVKRFRADRRGGKSKVMKWPIIYNLKAFSMRLENTLSTKTVVRKEITPPHVEKAPALCVIKLVYPEVGGAVLCK